MDHKGTPYWLLRAVFMHLFLSRLFITAKRIFNGKAAENVSSRTCFVFESLYECLHHAVIYFQLGWGLLPWTVDKIHLFPRPGSPSIKDWKEEAGCQLGARELGSVETWTSAQPGTPARPPFWFPPKFQQNKGKILFGGVIYTIPTLFLQLVLRDYLEKKGMVTKAPLNEARASLALRFFLLICSPSARRICPEVCIICWRTL